MMNTALQLDEIHIRRCRWWAGDTVIPHELLANGPGRIIVFGSGELGTERILRKQDDQAASSNEPAEVLA